MFKVSLEVLMSLLGEKHLKGKKTVTKENFTGTNTTGTIILLCQDECEEMMHKVDKRQIMRSLIYLAKNLLS